MKELATPLYFSLCLSSQSSQCTSSRSYDLEQGIDIGANPWEVQRLLKVGPFRAGCRKSSTNSPYLSRTGSREINQSPFVSKAFRRNFNGNISPHGTKRSFSRISKNFVHSMHYVGFCRKLNTKEERDLSKTLVSVCQHSGILRIPNSFAK